MPPQQSSTWQWHGRRRHSANSCVGVLASTAIGVLLTAHAATLEPYDINQDWLSDIEAKGANGCVIAPAASTLPLPPVTQPSSNSTTAQDIIVQGWRLAPVLYMHPMEWSLLTDPARWFNNTPIFDPMDLSKLSLSNLTSYTTEDQQLLVFNILGARFFVSGIWDSFGNSSSSTTSTAQLKQRVLGDPGDARNHSTAVVWFTAMDAHDAKDKVAPATYARGQAVIFKFHYFYPFNGCSNQLLALAIGGRYQLLPPP